VDPAGGSVSIPPVVENQNAPSGAAQHQSRAQAGGAAADDDDVVDTVARAAPAARPWVAP